MDQASKLELEEPTLPRKRKGPTSVDDIGQSEGYYPETPKGHDCAIYLETMDLLIQFIKDRFNQLGYQMYLTLEKLLLKAAKGEDYSGEFEVVIQMYKCNIDPMRLET